MGYGNVPDDWGYYFTTCSRCGKRYHQSEGGCGCMDDLECQCGANDWDCSAYDDQPRCSKCGSGSYVEGRTHTAVHRARKPYNVGRVHEVRPGDLYRRSVHFGYYPDGAFTLRVTRTRLEKGPAWGDECGERCGVPKALRQLGWDFPN